MIAGVGLDIVAIERIKAAMRRAKFLDRVLTGRERAIMRDPAWVAGRWAAKEAIAKAIGRPLRWHDVQVLAGTRGEPLVECAPHILPPGHRLRISITHERSMACAVAILESDGMSP